jgi:hypothetical protein
MTTHRTPDPVPRPVHRAVTAALVIAMSAGVAWTAGMVCTLLDWWA